MSEKILQCGICFESLNSKQIDSCTELDCKHIYHDKCLKEWCNTCIENNNEPNCPLCRKDILGEYLEILGINQNQNVQIYSMLNAINLFEYIIINKLFMDINKLRKIIEKHPEEFNNIYYMVEEL